VIVFFYPNLLGHSDNYIPANPMSTPSYSTWMIFITILCYFKIYS
jgi:hypothetical protein